MIVIVDYGTGNVQSILNMLRRIGIDAAEISAEIKKIEEADKLIFPGVGAFDFGMTNLKKSGLIPVLNKKVIDQKVPILGICLGMQLMTQRSEEGSLPGLGWIDAETIRFNFEGSINKRKIPHMGWNTVHICKENRILPNKDDEFIFYFVHSYHVVCHSKKDILTVTEYGYEFVSSFQKDNITGVQFHPEKSHKFGMKVMSNFASL